MEYYIMEKENIKEQAKTLNLEENTEQVAEIMPSEDEFSELLPKMNVGLPAPTAGNDVSNLIGDQELLDGFDEVIGWLREDRSQINEFIDNMADMVINEGDATSASKEALVNFVKMKSDLADKAAKILDLKTRIKLKERDTFPRYFAASQNNTINIGGQSSSRRSLIEAVNKAKKKGQQ
jgi:hypothetical protein